MYNLCTNGRVDRVTPSKISDRRGRVYYTCKAVVCQKQVFVHVFTAFSVKMVGKNVVGGNAIQIEGILIRILM